MLNTFASFAFYGSLVYYAACIIIAAVVFGFCVKWIIEAWLLNRRAKQWLERLNGMPQSADRACFKATRYCK